MWSRQRFSIAIAAVGVASAALVLGFSRTVDRLLVESPPHVRAGEVEVAVRTPFPGQGEDLELEVAVHDEYGATIEDVRVFRDRETVHAMRVIDADPGLGGDSSRVMRVPMYDAAAGRLTSLDVDVYYKVLGGHPLQWSPEVTANLHLDVPIYSTSERLWSQSRVAGTAWGMFLVWFLVVLAAARQYRRAPGDDPRDFAGPVVGLVGGAVIGYAVFARPLLVGFGVYGAESYVFATTTWLALPILWLWLQAKRRPALVPWLPGAQAKERAR